MGFLSSRHRPGLRFAAAWVLPLASLACLANTPPAKENRGVAVDASRIRIEFPQLFSSNPVGGELKPKSAFVGPSDPMYAAFAVDSRMPLGAHANHRGPRSACEASAAALCYDVADRRIVYRPARQYMPKLEGFTAESISLRRGIIRFKYSFR